MPGGAAAVAAAALLTATTANAATATTSQQNEMVEVTFIPCYVNMHKCLVLVVKNVSHFNSIKVLSEANENRSKMLNYVVHEIRSPLNSIVNYLNCSIEAVDVQVREDFLEPALQSAHMLNVLI